MDMSVYQWIASVLGIAGFIFSGYNWWDAQHKPVRESQQALRSALLEELRPVDFHKLKKAINQVETRMPSDQFKQDLVTLREYLLIHKDRFIAPSPAQLQVLADSLQAVLDLWDEIKVPYDMQDVYHEREPEPEDRKRLAASLQVTRTQIQTIINGINTIEKKPLSARRQVKLFVALEP